MEPVIKYNCRLPELSCGMQPGERSASVSIPAYSAACIAQHCQPSSAIPYWPCLTASESIKRAQPKLLREEENEIPAALLLRPGDHHA